MNLALGVLIEGRNVAHSTGIYCCFRSLRHIHAEMDSPKKKRIAAFHASEVCLFGHSGDFADLVVKGDTVRWDRKLEG